MAAQLSFIVRAVDEATAVLKRVGGEAESLGSRMERFGQIAGAAMLGGIGAIGAGLATALKASADFERGLNIVASVAQATSSELAGLRRTALDLGESTAFSAGQVLQAMEVLAANGISTSDIINGATKAALDLAAAGSTSLPQAADTVSTAMAVWNLSTADLTDTVNRLAGAANVSRFGVEDMALAIAQGGGAAAASGVNFRDFSAAIAAIAPLFSSGSDAGTSFKTFLQRLVPDTKRATEAFRELGLITADGSNKLFDASGKMKSMAEIAGMLNESLSKLSDQDRTRLLSDAFGTDAMRTAIGLSRMTREEFEALQRAMGEASAADIGAQRMKGFSGAMEQLQGAIETARIEIGDRLNPVATALAQRLAELVPVLKDRLIGAMSWFAREVVPRMQEALSQLRSAWERIEEPVMRFLRSREALQIGLGLLAAVLLSVAVAAGAAAAGMIAAVAPIAAIGLAIGGLLIVADKLGVDWGVVWERVRAVVGQAADWIRTAIEGIASVVGMVREHWGQISGAVSEAFGAIASAVQAVLGPVLNWLREQFTWLRGWWRANWDEIRTVATAVWGGISDAVSTAVQAIGQIVEGVGRLLVGVWRAVGDEILAIVRATWQIIAATVEFAIRSLMLTIQLVLNIITGDWREAWDTIKQMFETFLDFLRSAGSALLEIGKSVLRAFLDGLVAVWSNLIWPWLAGLGSKIVDQFSGMIDRMTDAGRDIIQGLWGGAKSAWNLVVSWAGGLMGEFLGAIGDAAQWLVDIGRQIMDGLWRGLRDRWDDVAGWIGGLGNKITSLKGPPATDRVLLYQIGQMIMEGLANGMGEGWATRVVPRIAEIGRGLIRNYQDVAEQARPLAGAIGGWSVEAHPAGVESWTAPGLQRMSQWARSLTLQPWGGQPPSAQPVHVSIEVDGRQLARAILPDLRAEAERQGVPL